MKILVVSGSFFPQNSPRSFRTTELVKEFTRQGHKVAVCIPDTTYDYSEFLKEYPVDFKFIDIPRRISKKRGVFLKQFIRSKINRFLYLFFDYPDILFVKLLPKLFSKQAKYDLIVSVAVPHPIHWGIVSVLKKTPQITRAWIADCGDPYMLCKGDSMPRPFYFKRFEKAFCKRADFITIPIEGAKEGYYPEFRDKLQVIPQGFDFSEIKRVDRYIPNSRVTFYYTGGFIPGKRDPRPLLGILCELDLDFHFIVHTRQDQLIESYKSVLGDKLSVRPYIDRISLIYEMSSADFLINMENNVREQSPSKLIDYALTKRPIISINTMDIDRDNLLKFLHGDYSGQTVVNVDDYDIKKIAQQFIALYNKCGAEDNNNRV